MTNCWFAGSVTCDVNQNYFGGLIGQVKKDSTIKNCLNTANVTNNGKPSTAATGWLVGYASGKLDISHSVNAATVTVAGGQYYGLLVGQGSNSLTIQNSHSLNKTGYNLVGNMDASAYTSTCGKYSVAEVTGDKALSQAKIGKLFTEADAKDYWSTNPNGFPVLKTFAEKILNQ